MQNIRRLYIYGVSLISLEVILWGSIGLLRSLFTGQEIGGGSVDRLAGALSLILVGTPIFLFHWIWAQRSARKELEERSSLVRALFLYIVLLITLVPLAQNTLSLIERILLLALGLDPARAILGGNQVWSDNLVAMIANGIAAFYFYWVLKLDWRVGPEGNAFKDIRRLYRYVWLGYSLVLVSAGLQQLIEFMLVIWESIGDGAQLLLANGLALLLVGVPIWIYTGRLIQRSLIDPDESGSLLRLTVLYLLVFIGVVGTLASVGTTLYIIIKSGLGETLTSEGLLGQIARPFSMAVPFAILWAYYGRSLRMELVSSTTPSLQPETASVAQNVQEEQRRAGLRRLYYYVLSFLGLTTSFLGLQFLFAALLDLAFGSSTIGGVALSRMLASAISCLMVGLPLWLLAWRPMVKEAASESETGDDARRSLIRRGYLFLILFAGVLGVMFSAGALLYQVLRAILGQLIVTTPLDILQQLKTMALFAGLLAYHAWQLRNDSRLVERTLSRRYAQYPVLIIAADETGFADQLVEVLQKQTPGLPVAVHPTSEGAPDPTLSAARAVIIPASVAARPSEAIRIWMQGYSGERLIVATPVEGWHWIPRREKSLQALARQAANTIRQLAETGQAAPVRDHTVLLIAIYIFAGLFILQLVLGLSIFAFQLLLD